MSVLMMCRCGGTLAHRDASDVLRMYAKQETHAAVLVVAERWSLDACEAHA